MSELSNKSAVENGSEPKVGLTPVPLWAVTLLGILVYALIVRSINSGGDFDPNVYGRFETPKEVQDGHPAVVLPVWFVPGRKVYGTYCVGCHQGNGAGAPGQFPPLAKSDWVNVEGPNRMVRIVLNGIQGPLKVNGVDYNNAMLAWRDQLTDQDIANVISYVRNEWGNKGSAATAAEVKAIRDATKDKGEQWTEGQLLQIPVK